MADPEEGASKEEILMNAAKRGELAIVNELIVDGANVLKPDGLGNTGLHYAAIGGHDDIITALHKKDKKIINIQNFNGDTALHKAAWKGHAKTCELLVKLGANLDIRNKNTIKAGELAKDEFTKAYFSKLAKYATGMVVDDVNDIAEPEDDDA